MNNRIVRLVEEKNHEMDGKLITPPSKKPLTLRKRPKSISIRNMTRVSGAFLSFS